ncbi:hypothetical protein EST38_g5945 [Candolleomyces aberdarensis]|uniref:Uncharacterized protein n=1 Tax=Candolleomyces aberdarensis TaxID=2316362 RepID=A0A4Q2DJ58_9AGAR|nr:hypothetical protein EST38_g5945 [Candolleomyces aberdarensis]
MSSTSTNTTTGITAAAAVADATTDTTTTATATPLIAESNIYLNGVTSPVCHRDLAPELLTWKRFQDELDATTHSACPTFQSFQTQSVEDEELLGSLTSQERLVFVEAMDQARTNITVVLDMLPKVYWARHMIDVGHDYDADDEEWEDAEEGDIEDEDPAGFLGDVLALGWFN